MRFKMINVENFQDVQFGDFYTKSKEEEYIVAAKIPTDNGGIVACKRINKNATFEQELTFFMFNDVKITRSVMY